MTVPPTWSIPESIRQRISPNSYGRQRTIFEDGHLILVLHKPPKPEDSGREGVLFWRTPNAEWQMSRGSGGSASLKRHLQEYADLENRLTTEFEAAPDTSSLFNLLERVGPLERAARNMHHAVQTAREAVKDDSFIIEMRDFADEIERNFTLLLEEVRNAIQYRSVREAETQARLSRQALRASHRLNVLAALFFPLTALTSFFGMNLPRSMFLGVLAVGLALGAAFVGWVIAKPREEP